MYYLEALQSSLNMVLRVAHKETPHRRRNISERVEAQD